MGFAETMIAPPVVSLQDDGSIRVAGTRVLLDTVVHEFDAGASAEEIAFNFDSLRLEEVYAAIAYYLRNAEEVRVYMMRRHAEGEELRRSIEARQPLPSGLKERLRQRAQGAGSAS